ncbi:putative bifunctional diguanylate cyclase/phosphodiesterase [Agaribacterium haliotis]|uniref:putative bifunctional diguanylate cyclase/phosphodiesterase n=1 Tax=Agaribacterium haliotis TaxID=2013869 RepID=UPI000BB562D2|nr:GGDEF and EAL domain-containing protein [Agaribacterium haliotis]
MQGYFEGISFRLAKVGVILALMIGIVMSAVQIYIDYQSQLIQTDAMINRIIKVATPPAERAVYTLDSELAEEVVTGLMQYEFIVEVALKDELGGLVASQERAARESRTRWLTSLISKEFVNFEAPLSVSRHDSSSGYISFVVDMDAAFSRFYQLSAVVIGIGLVRSSVLVLALFIVFYHMLTKPLIRIATEVKEINPGSPGEQRVSLPKSGRNDELKQLVLSTNTLLEAVDLALAKRRSVEVVLRKSEEHVRQIIDSLPVWVGARNRDGHYIFANKALANFLSTTAEAMRGAHVSDFKRHFATDTDEVVRLDAEVIDSGVNAQIWEEKWFDASGEERHMHTHIMPMDFYDETVALVVSSDITELKVTQELMEHMAYHDALTDLPNRSYLVERLEEEVKKASRRGVFGALLFIDLDQFKNINDSLGHPVGDAVLKHVAAQLEDSISDDDIVVRLGGDEFVVVLTELSADMNTAVLRAENIAERLRGSVAVPYYYNELELHVTASVGIVMFPEDDVSVHELLRYADTAMYQVKAQGRNDVEFFNKRMAENARDVLVMEGELHKALDEQSFELYYQPRVDMRSDRIVGAEALLRWNHPERGMVSPAEFIPVLETSGLIVKVGMWVLEQGMQQVLEWQRKGLWTADMRLGINISPRQFRSVSFVDDVAQLLKRLDFPARMLEMEITEGIVIHNLDVTIDTMATLRELGVVFSLDDFGTGYSSISYLKKLPVAILKIDQSFVRDICVDRNDRVLVETISAMGQMLDLEVVAEGVETQDQLDLIRQYHCRYYQGYLCSRPVTAEKFVGLLEHRDVDWI